MNRIKIVTHPGRAHRDEYLSCCAIIYHVYRSGNLAYIERRIPGDSDLANPDTWVIDTGGVHDPQRRNFDHHQEDETLSDKCALDLVLAELLPENQMKLFKITQSWLRVTALHDNSSVTETAAALRIPLQAYVSTRSPVEKAMLQMFSELVVIHPESPLYHVMRETGRLLFVEAERLSVDLEDRLSVVPAPFQHAGLRVWDIRQAWRDSSDHLELALVNQAASKRCVDVIIGRNMRQATTGMYRTHIGTAKLDMTRLKGMPGVRFFHKNGFYVVLEPDVTDTAIMALLSAAAERGGTSAEPELDLSGDNPTLKTT
jgi:hypothetical protein